MSEALLNEDNNRLTVLPIRYHDVWAAYKKHEAAMWHAVEIDLSKDKADWIKLTDGERHFVKHVLAFFASSDLIVAENLTERFMREVKMTEAKIFYSFQNTMENIHSEVYSNLIEAYISDEKEKTMLFNAVKTIPCVGKKAAWADKWITSTNVFAERLVAFAMVEGVFFSGSFCCIYWLASKNKLPGLWQANDFIARDEGMHTDFACLLYTKYVQHLPQSKIEEIVRECVEIESEFITESLPCRLLGMDSSSMIQYIKYVANRLVQQLGHEKIYENIENPFDFMATIGMHNKNNFFEMRPTEYQLASTAESTDEDAYADL